MNEFLGKLINRHQQSINHDAASFVTPRPKSRFESDSVGSLEGDGTDASDAVSTPINQRLVETGSAEQRRNRGREQSLILNEQATPSTKSFESDRLDKQEIRLNDTDSLGDLSERADAFSRQLSNKVSATEPTSDTQVVKAIPQNESVSNGPDNELHPNNRHLALTDELDQRIQSLVKRLSSQPLAARGEQNQLVPQTQSNSGAPEPEPQLPFQSLETPQGLTAPAPESGTLNNDSPPEQRPTPQRGLLQPPDWLSDVRSDISKRWQDINAQQKPSEPVVNVTIGRVEVKAVQAGVPQQPRRKKKPSGVMSLDDYLKERA